MARKKSPTLLRFEFLKVALLLSFLLNLIFIVNNYRRNIVVSVPDGDSLQMADGRRIRLLGVDAPEKGSCMASVARDSLDNLANGKHVRLKKPVTDDYGRILAIVIAEQPDIWLSYMKYWIAMKLGSANIKPDPDPLLNRAIVREGLAKFEHNQNEYYDTLKDAENSARNRKTGIWSDVCRPELPPDSTCAIKGNVRGGEKKYYLPDCRFYKQVIVDLSYGDAWFCSEREALGKGYISGCLKK